MEWFFIALLIVSAILYALSTFVDNYITDAFFRGRRPEASKVFAILAYALTLVGLLIFSPPTAFSLPYFGLLLASGASDAVASIFYYRALVHEETTGMTILTQLFPVLTLVSGFFILGDQISPPQLVGIALLLFAALLIVFSLGSSRRRLRMQLRAAALLVITMIFWTTASTLFVFSGEEMGFASGFFYIMLGHFITNTLLVLIMKSWRVRARNIFREFRWKIIAIYLTSHGVWLAGEILFCMALLSGPIAIAAAVNSTAQLIAAFVFGLAFTVIWPRFGREKLTRRTVSYHLMALIVSVVAIFLIQLS